jgi:protein-disulfide isomerase
MIVQDWPPVDTHRMTHTRKLGSKLVLALFASLLACSKAPSSAIEPDVGSGEPVASGTIMDAATPERVLVEPPTLDQAHVAELGVWVAANVAEPRYQVDIEHGAPGQHGDLVLGPHDALVTFVVFSDYQCPYCKRLDDDLHALLDTYPNDIRIVIKQFPLPMHTRARIAAQVLLAAQIQGRGEVMHSLLFANAKSLDDVTLQDLARQAQVPDLARFWADVQDGFGDAKLDADLALGGRLAITSTPTFFVNGVLHKGAKTLEELQALYLAELGVVDQLLAAGAARPEVYAGFMAAASPTREGEVKRKPTTTAGKPDPLAHYAVPVDDRPSTGPDDALVTIIEFADFECPYCRKVTATLDEIKKHYGKDVRIVFRQQPLPGHKHAVSAALASLAAHEQGKFWEMNALLFAAAEAKQLGNYEELAKQLGLDLAKFRADMADSTIADQVTADQKVASQFGATGIPTFFINGRYFSGARPLADFQTLIDEELAAAKKWKSKHKVTGSKLYATMSRDWETNITTPPSAAHQRETIEVKQLPRIGKAKKPAVTIVGCVDFDCPFCARGAAVIQQVLSTAPYDAKVAYHLAHFPLPMHKTAAEAHRAAIAAGEQGKFWEMHDLLFAERSRRGDAELLAMATQLGLDLDKFRADASSTSTANKLADDIAMCTKLGVTGTPTYFINGRRTQGALPFDMMTEILDEEIAGGFEAKSKSKTKTK